MLWMDRACIGSDRAVVCQNDNFPFRFGLCNLRYLAIESIQVCSMAVNMLFNTPLEDVVGVVDTKTDTLLVLFGDIGPKSRYIPGL